VSAASVFAQDVISAKSGLVHYIEGDVSVAGQPASEKTGVFTDIKKDEVLNTALGRAEVLMTPGVFLRVGEQSSIRMLSNTLSDTRVEILTGSSMLESDTPMKGNAVTVVYKDYTTTFLKHGLFEFQTRPAQLRVYSGEAQVTAGGQTVTVREGRMLSFTAALAQERFDAKDGDSLYRWSKVRSEYLSIANVSAAKYSPNGGSGFGNGFGNGFGTGFGNGGYGLNGGLGGWAYNSLYGMYTYLPYNGIAYSPFGFSFYSPYTVYQAYQPYGSSGGSGSYGASSYANGKASNHSPVIASSGSGAGSGSGTAAPSRSGVTPAPSPVGGAVAGGGSHAGGHGK
jgi:hypothetical protein